MTLYFPFWASSMVFLAAYCSSQPWRFFCSPGSISRSRQKTDLGQLLAVGIVVLIFTYTFLNIGMTISITPITGLPLPLISYGGSFLLMILFGLGILQSVWIHRKTVR